MAKAERKSNPFGWIVVGALVGAIATMGVLMIASSMTSDRGYQDGPTEIRTAADDAASAAAARPPVAIAAPKPEQPGAPVATIPAPAAAQPAQTVDAQMADDAAAAGMTSRAGSEQPIN
ncbi:hypothetical protein ASD79_13945 [Caulobacter sp. Root655]|uniref:hypothetical protein n=1 Tax=Caulobacter sp. Root655 TaxID=1736578 RepID=UPI0006FDD505|nr:hypothetical protein [Caulobacter sp. Root655]KRA58413.1 hypothetical protein ASD79_13945 [Caulobacter sp. Root655]